MKSNSFPPLFRRLILGFGLGVALLGGGVSLGSLYAEDRSENRFDAANHAFASEHYAEAVEGYEAVLATEGYSAPVLFNLANSYFRLGQVGRSVFNYERAALLAPRDPDIAANLRLVRRSAGLPDPAEHWYQNAAQALTGNQWAWLGCVGAVAGCLGLFLAYALPRAGRVPLTLLAAMAFGLALVAVTAVLIDRPHWNQAIVITSHATARLSPFEDAQESFPLPEGAAITILSSHDAFFLVRSQDGRSGWLAKREAEAILPTTRHSS